MHSHHEHDHRNETTESGIKKAFWLNFCFAFIELIGGILTGSTAILADAIHDFGDSMALAVAWLMQRLSNKTSNIGFTYGYKRLSVLAAVINATVLIVGSFVVMLFALLRMRSDYDVQPLGMMILAVLGVLVNGYAALRVLKQPGNLNAEVVKWHLLEDALGWIAVLIGSIVIFFTGWMWVDTVLAVAIAVLVVYQASKRWLRGILVLLQASPSNIDLQKLQIELSSIPDVIAIHDCQLWSEDGESHVLSVHIVADIVTTDDYLMLKNTINKKLAAWPIAHSTVEVELSKEACRHIR